MVANDEINNIGEELNIHTVEYNLVNNVILKLEEFDELSTRKTHLMRPKYVLAGRSTFCLGSSQEKPHP